MTGACKAGALVALLAIAGCRDGSAVLVGVPDDPPTLAQAKVPEPFDVPAMPELDREIKFGRDGIPGPLPGVYTDKGKADEDDEIRGLISFPIRDVEELEERIRDINDPGSPNFRKYMTPQEWIDRYAPHQQDVQIIVDWLKSEGLDVPRVATNRLLIQFYGRVGDFNRALGTELRVLSRKSPQQGNAPHDVYGLDGRISVPQFVRERIRAVVAADLPAETEPLRPEGGPIRRDLPSPIENGLTPEQIAHAYGLDDLYARGFRGQGIKLGVTIGASFRFRDIQSFWETFGVFRSMPQIVETMEPPSTRYREGTLDVEWAGVMAPDAELIVYMGPDARNTSMIYTFNEAIARGEVSIISDSFAHRDDSEPWDVHRAYHASATMAAALGITVVAAAGDSGGADVPSTSTYVTSVGGTFLIMDGNSIEYEGAWNHTGCGVSKSIPRPDWQANIYAPGETRAVNDVALNAAMGYWYKWLGEWYPNIGTSFGTPAFAGLLAVVNSARAAEGKPPMGWINEQLYTNPEVQRAFRDITVGESYTNGPTRRGWDFATGWGAPDAAALLRAMP